MQVQLTLNGFDGGVDTTDHLIKWVSAASRDEFDQWYKQSGLEPHCTEVDEIFPENDLSFEQGLDGRVDGINLRDYDGNIVSIQDWITESQDILRAKKTPWYNWRALIA